VTCHLRIVGQYLTRRSNPTKEKKIKKLKKIQKQKCRELVNFLIQGFLLQLNLMVGLMTRVANLVSEPRLHLCGIF